MTPYCKIRYNINRAWAFPLTHTSFSLYIYIYIFIFIYYNAQTITIQSKNRYFSILNSPPPTHFNKLNIFRGWNRFFASYTKLVRCICRFKRSTKEVALALTSGKSIFSLWGTPLRVVTFVPFHYYLTHTNPKRAPYSSLCPI